MLELRRGGTDTLSALRRHLLRRRSRLNTVRAAVVADSVHVHVVDHVPVVHIVDVGEIHVIDRAVVVEIAPVPISTPIANTGVAEAVVNASVEADGRPPVARMPVIEPRREAPVSGRPEEAYLRSGCPGSRYPVITTRAISPVTRRPDVSRARAQGLRVHGQGWRTDRYRDIHT